MSGQLYERLAGTIDFHRHLFPFMSLSGWKDVDPDNPLWHVWQGMANAEGRPCELVFPKAGGPSQRYAYTRKAIEFLAAVNNETEEWVAIRVAHYDRDLLLVRNLDTDPLESLRLGRVVDQLDGIRLMLLHSASAEYRPRPYYAEPAQVARTFVHNASFGHTLPGSFVFTISGPPIVKRGQQLTLDFAEGASSELRSLMEAEQHRLSTPFERRVSERIARGLTVAEQSAQLRDHSVLLEHYGDGLNSNMCTQVARIAGGGRSEVAFEFVWSQVLPAAEDVTDILPVLVNKDQCDNLRAAAEKLKDTRQEPVTVRGNVHGIVVNGDPKRPDSRRSMILHGTNPITGRAAQFGVELAASEYAAAVKAQSGWSTIEVTGIPLRSGAAWRLAESRGFRLLS